MKKFKTKITEEVIQKKVEVNNNKCKKDLNNIKSHYIPVNIDLNKYINRNNKYGYKNS